MSETVSIIRDLRDAGYFVSIGLARDGKNYLSLIQQGLKGRPIRCLFKVELSGNDDRSLRLAGEALARQVGVYVPGDN